MEQLFEKQNSFRPELREALFQQLILMLMIAAGRMLGTTALLSGGSGRIQIMTRNLLYVGAVDNEFAFRNAHWQQFSDALPGHRIKVLQIGDVAFRIHRPVQDLGRIVRLRG